MTTDSICGRRKREAGREYLRVMRRAAGAGLHLIRISAAHYLLEGPRTYDGGRAWALALWPGPCRARRFAGTVPVFDLPEAWTLGQVVDEAIRRGDDELGQR